MNTLKQAIERAIAGGWRFKRLGERNWRIEVAKDGGEMLCVVEPESWVHETRSYYPINTIIFNHDFCRCLFKNEPDIDISETEGLSVWKPAWFVRIQELATSPDRIEYLQGYLDE